MQQKQTPPPTAKRPPLKTSTRYTCTISASCGFKRGKIYITYKNDDGYTCLEDDQGYEHLTCMLISEFKPSTMYLV